MAVYTAVSKTDLQEFLQFYDCGTLQRFEGILQGVENSNFHVFTDKGRYILTIFEGRISEEKLPFVFSYMDHLAGRGITCPQVKKDVEGNSFRRLYGKPAGLISFMEGGGLETADITADYCAQLGTFLARMHRATANFQEESSNHVGLAEWQRLANITRSRADEVQEGLARHIDSELAFLAENWPQNLPKTVVHLDIFPDNVFFKDGQIVGMIDFYFSSTEFWAYDLAIVINAWCFDSNHEFKPDFYEALMGAYQDIRPLTDEERQTLPILCRGAALRFLMTRLYDWLNHPGDQFVQPKDPKEYLKKLEFFSHEPTQIAC